METSIYKVLKNKLVNYLAENTTADILKQVAELAAGLLLGALVVSPDTIVNFLLETLKTSNYAIPKFAFVFSAFYYRKSVFRFFRIAGYYLKIREAKKNDEQLIENIPVPEMVDYLIRNKHFKREGINGVRSTFGLSMERFNELAKKLENSQVLVRGENNGRILADHWTRQSLNDFLSGHSKISEIAPRFKICRIGGKVRLDRPELQTTN